MKKFIAFYIKKLGEAYMSETLTIHDVCEDTSIREKVHDAGKFLFFSWGEGFSDIKYRLYGFRVQYPSGDIKYFEYFRTKLVFRANSFGTGGTESPEKEVNSIKRASVLQSIINDLERDGYSVMADQLSLFMNGKIPMLIIQK